jgi:hypothetical protein
MVRTIARLMMLVGLVAACLTATGCVLQGALVNGVPNGMSLLPNLMDLVNITNILKQLGLGT